MQTHGHALSGMLAASSICKDEVFAGFISRQRCRALRAPMRQLLGSNNRRVPWFLPTRLKELVPLWGDCVGSLDSVLANNTLVPGFNRFLSPTDKDLQFRHHTGTEIIGITATLGLMSSRHRDLARSAWSPGVCFDCLDEDIAPTGDRIWRRDLLMRHVHLCPRHSTAVYDFCGSCYHGFGNSMAIGGPRSRCVCGGPLRRREHLRGKALERLELALAIGWHRLLDATFAPHADGQLIAAVACQKARELGIVKGRQVKWERYIQTFLNPVFGKLGDSLRFPFKSRRVNGFLLGQTTLRNPFHALFVLLAMFGNWEEIESALGSTTTAPDLSLAAGKPTKHRNSAEARARWLAQSIQRLPQTCLLYESLRNKHPYLSHSSLRAQLPSMNALAATQERLRAHGVRFDERDISHALDASAATHIERQAQQLIEAGAPYRLSRQRLMTDHPLRNSWQHAGVRNHSPKTAAALETHLETWVMFYRRQLPEKIRAGLVPGWQPQRADEIDQLTDEEVHALWQRHTLFLRRSCKS